MYCQNCGKLMSDNFHFCTYCGAKLEIEPEIVETEDEIYDSELFESQEELVLLDVKRHWMSLFVPAFMTPIFLAYFWYIFLGTEGMKSYFVALIMLAFIVYPIMRFKNDRMVITNKFAHIKIGTINKKEFNIAINKFDTFSVNQSLLGKMLDYGTIVFYMENEKYEFPYIEAPECMQKIFSNPKKYLSDL